MAYHTTYHHRNPSRGAARNGAPAQENCGGTSIEILTRQMNDEDWAQAMARVNLKRRRYNGRIAYEEPTKSEGDKTPHGTV